MHEMYTGALVVAIAIVNKNSSIVDSSNKLANYYNISYKSL